MADCEKTGSCCETKPESKGECGSASPQDCCPVELAAQKWSASFCQAMTEVQVDILKEKIKKAWGSEMEKVGDAVLEAMGAQWHAMLKRAKAHVDLRENIKKVFLSGQK